MGKHVALVLALFACGGSNSPAKQDAPLQGDAPAVDAALPVTVADLCGPNGVLDQLFAKELSCNPAFDVLLAQGRLTPTVISMFCDGALGPYVTDGSITLGTRAEVNACLAYIASTPCLDFVIALSSGGPCDLMNGQVANAGSCDITDQCADASYCDHSAGGACGACTMRLADGFNCTADEQCAGGACIGSQCGHLGNDGEPCFADNDCLGKRTCDLNTHTCATVRWVVNQACTPNTGDCNAFDTGLYCKQNPTGAQCAPFLPLNAACRVGGVAQGLCDVRAYDVCPAGNDAVCSPPTIETTENSACGLLQGQKCATGMACSNPLGGTCIQYQQLGQTCVNGGAPTDQCDLLLACVNAGTGFKCQYGAYTGTCP
jgi:hypothetical protein